MHVIHVGENWPKKSTSVGLIIANRIDFPSQERNFLTTLTLTDIFNLYH